MCLLRAMGLEPSVCHMNEGHSAFLSLERIRMLMRDHVYDDYAYQDQLMTWQ